MWACLYSFCYLRICRFHWIYDYLFWTLWKVAPTIEKLKVRFLKVVQDYTKLFCYDIVRLFLVFFRDEIIQISFAHFTYFINMFKRYIKVTKYSREKYSCVIFLSLTNIETTRTVRPLSGTFVVWLSFFIISGRTSLEPEGSDGKLLQLPICKYSMRKSM